MNLSKPFIERPVMTTLVMAALVIFGAFGYASLPVSDLPNIDFPTISVSAGLPGASPETMASAVAAPLERRLGRIAGVNEITSASSLGATSLTLQFSLERDVEAAARDVQAAINAAAGDLPPNLPTRPRYQKVNPADAPVLILSLTSETLPLAQVYDAATSVLAQKISQVNGVGQVFVGGGQQPAVRVQADPEALVGVGLGLADVRAAVAAATVNQPKGSLSGGGKSVVLSTNDQLTRADDYRPLVIAYKDGAPVRLGDVAHVIDSVENTRNAAWSGGGRAVLIIIRRQPGANIIEVIERVKALLPALSHAISPAVRVTVAADRSQTIRASVADVELTLVLSVFLVVLVVFLFLRSARATSDQARSRLGSSLRLLPAGMHASRGEYGQAVGSSSTGITRSARCSRPRPARLVATLRKRSMSARRSSAKRGVRSRTNSSVSSIRELIASSSGVSYSPECESVSPWLRDSAPRCRVSSRNAAASAAVYATWTLCAPDMSAYPALPTR